jgi:hypothetical protein
MIKALLLIFDPVAAWERIVVDQRKWVGLLSGYLLPLLLLTSLVEGYGLMRWGKPPPGLTKAVALTLPEAGLFEVAQLILSLLVVFAGAQLVKLLSDNLHSRHSFNQAFTVTVYGLSPVFAMRMFNAFEGVSPWVTWTIGIILSFWILYQGIPRVMKSDPSHAFGLYLTSILFLAMISGVARLLTASYLKGNFSGLEEILSRLLA